MSSVESKVEVQLDITAQEMLRWYSGGVKNVVAYARDGRRVRFPVELLRPFVSRTGVAGCFAIQFDHLGKFVSISQL